MKLHSRTLELRAIRTICSESKESAVLLGRLHEGMFHTEAGLACFTRISRLLKDGGRVPSFKMLSEDPVIKASIREEVGKFEEPKLSKNEYEDTLTKLRNYRSTRDMLYVFEKSINALNSDEGVDIETLLNDVADHLGKIRSGSDNTKVWSFGSENNASELINNILQGKSERLIPTMFDAWDSENGGIPETACMIMAAGTGGGKSIMAATLCKKLAESGYRPGVIPLEMSAQQMTARLVSAVTKIPVNKIIQADTLTDNEKALIAEGMKKWIRKVKSENGAYKIFEMGYTPNIMQALYTALPYGLDILIVDYVALLDGMDGDSDWRNLSEAVRAGKRFAMQHKIPVVFLAQLGDDKKLRYSKRMLDDADIAWVWFGDDEAKDTGIIHISSPKARNMIPLNFELFVEWSNTFMRDLTDDEADSAASSRASEDSNSSDEADKKYKGKGKKSKRDKNKFLKDMTSVSNKYSDIG